MRKNNVVFICVQPAIQYYAWQVEVMLKNFRDLGIHHRFDIHCLFAYNRNLPNWEKEQIVPVRKVEKAYRDVADFFYYEDTRVTVNYISSIRPNILKQHFKQIPTLKDEVIFYHDCDIVFTKFPDFIYQTLKKDNICYVSDTISYIGHDYIVSKGDGILEQMCEIVGIHPSLVKSKQNESGGAQYILKGLDWVFFEKMERDCDILFKRITDLNVRIKGIVHQVGKKYKGYTFIEDLRKDVIDEVNSILPDCKIKNVNFTINNNIAENIDYHELQIWCSDMWALLWNLWMRGYSTEIIPEMSFLFATDNISEWDKKYIFHNAGVVGDGSDSHLFYKYEFNKTLPYLVEKKLNPNFCSYKYYEIIQSIGLNSALVPKGDGVEAKINDVIDLFIVSFTPTRQEEEKARKRLRACLTSGENGGECENYVDGVMPRCKGCNCPLKSNIFTKPKDTCPLNKWED